MIRTMKLRWSDAHAKLFAAICTLVFLLGTPAWLFADDEPAYDARIEGYSSAMWTDGGTTALMWLLYIVVGLVCLSVLFKDARRTHLD